MDLPKIRVPQIGGFEGLKEKLGIGEGRNRDDEPYDEGDLEAYDDDYGNGYGNGYTDDYADDYDAGYDADYADAYDAPAPAAPADRFQTGPISASQQEGGAYPKLISFEDVRAHTIASEEARRAAAEKEKRAREEVQDVMAAQAAAVSRVEAAAASVGAVHPVSAPVSGAVPASAGSERPAKGYNSLFGDPSEMEEFTVPRMISVVRPFKYDEVEEIANSLKRGDAVVLDLAATPPDLARRILDFGFGAASMAEATVDCLASKVFSIQSGDALSREELNRLRSQGVI